MMSSAKKKQTSVRSIRLQDAVVIALVFLIVTSVGISSALWYRNGRDAAAHGARMVQREIGARIEGHISRFLAVPHEINTANAAAFELVDLEQFGADALESLLVKQIQIFESISSIYVGSPEGGLIDAGREGAGGSLYVIVTKAFRNGTFHKFALTEQGTRGELLDSVDGFDARTRPWYTSAVEKGQATWSDIYTLFSGQDMAIAASRPVYDSDGNLLMVLSSDIFL